jgi:Spy/CpxP family protein refolding chaperone
MTDASLFPVSNRSGQRRWAVGVLTVAVSAAMAMAVSAWAADAPPMGMSAHHGHAMMGPEGGMPFGLHHLGHWLDEAQATPAQRSQIKQIASQAEADLRALHEQGETLHEQGLKLWAQPTIDADAAEKLRQQMLAQHDKVSKRMMQAMLDIGKVLTPEQRAKVVADMQKRHEQMMKRMHDRSGGPAAASQPASR